MNLQPITEAQRMQAALILKISGLKIRATFLRFQEGPVVTTFFFRLNTDEPIKKILNKEEDFAIACGVESCLISRQGDAIAIEIPNKERRIVTFGDCLNKMMLSQEARSMSLPILLGVDSNGKNAYLDLATQPHILIAGSTNSGKSILLSSIISGLAVARDPRAVRLTFVDTKRLDLVLFEQLPHKQVLIENVQQFQNMMDKIMALVRSRTEQMRGRARNAREWNLAGYTPYMTSHVIIIDELADLMDLDTIQRSLDPEYDEKYQKIPARIKSLIQICRAAGVHVIAATQRASVRVISGDIKTNFPTRIGLRVPSRVDSQTILTGTGAEKLLGKGDMLVESQEYSVPRRYHGAYISAEEIEMVIKRSSEIRESFKMIGD